MATRTVRLRSESHNSTAEALMPRYGVVVLSGYEVEARVDRGHLILRNRIGAFRQFGRFPRIGHNLRRLVVVGFRRNYFSCRPPLALGPGRGILHA